ncbi:MAG: PEGA domain-containing protein [Myxococcota bacterium]
MAVLLLYGQISNAATRPTERKVAPRRVDVTYVFWGLSPLGLSEQTGRSVSGMFHGELKDLLGDQVLAAKPWMDSEIRDSVAACKPLSACLAEAARAYGADRLIHGTVATIGDSYGTNLRMIDARRRRVIAKAGGSLRGERDRLLAQVRHLLLQLVAPDQLTGSLALEVDLDGQDVYVDGEHVGVTPLPDLVEGLAAGQHSLKISSPQIKDHLAFFTIDYGKTSPVFVEVAELEIRPEAGRISAAVPMAVGLKLGYASNFGAVSTPIFLAELAFRLAPLQERVQLSFESGYYQSSSEKTLRGVDLKARISLWVVPLLLRLAYRHPILPGITAYGGLAGGYFFLVKSIRSPILRRVTRRHFLLAYGGFLGGDVMLGPGRVTVETRYTDASLDGKRLSGNVAGMAGVLGYRVDL